MIAGYAAPGNSLRPSEPAESSPFTVSALVEGEVPFKALSYQRFVSNFRALAGPSHDPYFRYMKERDGLAGSS